MKKVLLTLLAAVLLSGCAQAGYIVFTGAVEEIYENGVLVATDDLNGNDRASVGFAEDMQPFEFNLLVGQRLEITALPEIRESYPVQVTAVKIRLLTDTADDSAVNSHNSMPEDTMDKDAQFETITVEQAMELMESESDCMVLDVRTKEEYDEGHIPGAVLLPDYEILSRAQEVLPEKDAVVLVYCRSGRRSALAAQSLAQLGYTQVKDFGGIIDWMYGITKE